MYSLLQDDHEDAVAAGGVAVQDHLQAIGVLDFCCFLLKSVCVFHMCVCVCPEDQTRLSASGFQILLILLQLDLLTPLQCLFCDIRLPYLMPFANYLQLRKPG